MTITMALCALGAAPAWAAPPANDAYTSPTTLPAGTVVDGTLTGATPDSVTISSATERSVWFEFTAPTAGTYTANVCGATTSATRVNVNAFLPGTPPTRPELRSMVSCDAAGNDNRQAYFVVVTPGPVLIGVSDTAPAADDPGAFKVRVAKEPFTTVQLLNQGGTGDLRALTLSGGGPSATARCTIDAGPEFDCGRDAILLGDLPVGTHTFSAAGIEGGATDPTPATVTFTIDHDSPSSDGATLTDADTPNPTLHFDPDPGIDSWDCSFDGLAFTECGDYGGGPFKGICNGDHTLDVRARDESGNVSPTPKHFALHVNEVGNACGTPTAEAQYYEGDGIYFVSDTKGQPVNGYLEYGTTAAYGRTQGLRGFGKTGATLDFDSVRADITTPPGTTMYYRAVAVLPDGTKILGEGHSLAIPPLAAPGESTPDATFGTPKVRDTSIDVPYSIRTTPGTFIPGITVLVDANNSHNGGLGFSAVSSVLSPADGSTITGKMKVTGLKPGTRYSFVAAYLSASGDPTFGEPIEFTTLSAPAPASFSVAGDLTFGTTGGADVPAARTVTLTNDGQFTGTLPAITIGDAFTVDASACGAMLAAETSCDVIVTPKASAPRGQSYSQALQLDGVTKLTATWTRQPDPPTGAATTPTTVAAGTAPVLTNPLGKLTLPRILRISVLKKGFKPKLQCKAACSLRIRLLKGRLVYAAGTAKLGRAGTATVNVRPTALGRRTARKARKGKRIKLTLVAEALDAKGKALGSIKRSVSLK